MTVYVITHKPIESPLDKGYTPMLIGADFNKNPKHYMTDNTGKNTVNLLAYTGCGKILQKKM